MFAGAIAHKRQKYGVYTLSRKRQTKQSKKKKESCFAAAMKRETTKERRAPKKKGSTETVFHITRARFLYK